MKRSLRVILPIILLSLMAVAAYANVTTTVLSVVDGDTLKVSFQGKKENVRLIGIDSLESRINPKAKKDANRSGED